MSDQPHPPSPSRLVLRAVLSVLLILWTLVWELLDLLLGPLVRALSGLRIFEALGALLGSLPPYVALLLFAVPFIVIEPVKVFSLYWFGIGHFIQGGALYVLAHLASILIVERLYHAMHAPLMRIGWFKRLMTWLDGLRRVAIDWAKSTAIWQAAAKLATDVRKAARSLLRARG